MKRFWTTILACTVPLIFGFFQHAFGADPIARISSVDGKVEIQRAGKQAWVFARLGEPLFEGDVLQTHDRSKASLLFSSGSIATIQPKTRMTLVLRNTETDSKTFIGSLSKELIAGIGGIFPLQKKKETLTAIPGIRKKIEQEEMGVMILHPRNSKILTSKPLFRWKTQGKPASFAVSLTLKGMKGRLWNTTTDQMEISYPADQGALEGGQTYFVRVESRGNPQLSDEVFFNVMEEKETALVERAKEQMEEFKKQHPADATPMFVLAALYKSKGLFHLALEELDRLETLFLNDRFIAEEKLDILAKMGFWKEWEQLNQKLTGMPNESP